MDWYNGYSPAERNANGRQLSKAIKEGTVPRPSGACTLCGNPNVPLEYHSEDYSKPYNWLPPAAFPVCLHCHRSKLHKRFANPNLWHAFAAHVRRGGYASDLVSNSKAKREVDAYRDAYDSKAPPAPLPFLRPYHGVVGQEWWANLTMDSASLTAASARSKRPGIE